MSAPKQFKPIGEEYRSLYAASIMSSPNYTGTAVGSSDTAAFYALGEVENNWLAIPLSAAAIWWVYPANAGVPEARYKSTLRKDLPRAHAPPNRTASKSAATARRVKRRFSYRILQ